MTEPGQSRGELVLYTTVDGQSRFFLRADGGSVWLSQGEIAALFQTTPQNITQHIKAIYAEGELTPEATCKSSLQVREEGARTVRRSIKAYNLDIILAVGYRVRSPRGTQFRQWATTHLKEYLVKGFVLDDARLKDPQSWDYFDELLRRIRDIRASEKRFYQKVRDLFALSTDYRDDLEAAGRFFAEVQNKMLFAVTRHTAAEIVVQRADAAKPNMALTTWKSGRVRKEDVIVAKNYLDAAEIDQLNRIVSLFLDFAELRTQQRQQTRMADWKSYVDNFIQFNERPLLQNAGRVSHDDMVRIAHERYGEFDAKRKHAESAAADEADIKALVDVEKKGREGGKNAS